MWAWIYWAILGLLALWILILWSNYWERKINKPKVSPSAPWEKPADYSASESVSVSASCSPEIEEDTDFLGMENFRELNRHNFFKRTGVRVSVPVVGYTHSLENKLFFAMEMVKDSQHRALKAELKIAELETKEKKDTV